MSRGEFRARLQPGERVRLDALMEGTGITTDTQLFRWLLTMGERANQALTDWGKLIFSEKEDGEAAEIRNRLMAIDDLCEWKSDTPSDLAQTSRAIYNQLREQLERIERGNT